MLYAVVPLAGDDPKLPDGLKGRVKIMNERYAPKAWFITFDGTTDELTDLIWPEEMDEDDHPMPLGMVIRMDRITGLPRHSYGNGWECIIMNDEERVRRPDSTEKNREPPAGSSQWMMYTLNRIDARLDRIDTDLRALGQSTKDDIQELKKSVDTVKKVIWTAAGIAIMIGLLGSFLFESGDLITRIPFEITIKSPPGP